MANVEKLIKEGIIPLTGEDSVKILAAFEQLRQTVTPQLVEKIPESINGIAIRGRFGSGKGARRRGIYFGPDVAAYLPEDARPVISGAYNTLTSIAKSWLDQIAQKYGLNVNKLRPESGDCFDTLTIAIYDGTTGEDTALTGHTDYGLLTVGVADQEGLEIFQNGSWVPVPAGTPYIHTATWLQRALRQVGVVDIHKATHRVKNCASNRFFAGVFFEPAAQSEMDGKLYSDFIRESFASSYDHHATVNIDQSKK